jgi:hypothetical protein
MIASVLQLALVMLSTSPEVEPRMEVEFSSRPGVWSFDVKAGNYTKRVAEFKPVNKYNDRHRYVARHNSSRRY